jgi:tetratricopeptide (TPR) repeat protein
LKLAGNYSGAIQRLEEANRLQPEEPEILVELGECWQHLRQFAKALDYYRQAIGRAVVEDETRKWPESLVLARYRAGVLLAAMGRPDEAATHFSEVVAKDASYKDAQQRLDKLRAS